jgi:hypothetical protein
VVRATAGTAADVDLLFLANKISIADDVTGYLRRGWTGFRS